MKARLMRSEDLAMLVNAIRRRGYEVVAPFCNKGRDTYYDMVTDENIGRVRLHVPNPYYPPKRFVLPPIERLLRVKRANGAYDIQATYEAPKRAIFGIRSCDVAGIYHLDRFYLGREFPDTYYARRRRELLLVNVVCTNAELDISDACFCVCTDTGPAARDHFDLQLMDLGRRAACRCGNARWGSPV